MPTLRVAVERDRAADELYRSSAVIREVQKRLLSFIPTGIALRGLMVNVDGDKWWLTRLPRASGTQRKEAEKRARSGQAISTEFAPPSRHRPDRHPAMQRPQCSALSFRS